MNIDDIRDLIARGDPYNPRIVQLDALLNQLEQHSQVYGLQLPPLPEVKKIAPKPINVGQIEGLPEPEPYTSVIPHYTGQQTISPLTIEPIRVDVQPITSEPTHIRGMRKQWAGKALFYNPANFDVIKSQRYALRSMGYKHAQIEGMADLVGQDKRLRKSISHVLPKHKIEGILTVTVSLENALEEAAGDYGVAIYNELTATQQEAFETFIDFSAESCRRIATEIYLRDASKPVLAFTKIEEELKRRIMEEWENYHQIALKERASDENMLLTAEQVDALPDADLSWMKGEW